MKAIGWQGKIVPTLKLKRKNNKNKTKNTGCVRESIN